VTEKQDRTEKRAALFDICAKAMVAAPVCGALSYIPSLSGLSYIAVASLIIAGFAGLTASETRWLDGEVFGAFSLRHSNATARRGYGAA